MTHPYTTHPAPVTPHSGTILGFFLGDELPWNGLPYADVETYARAVRATFPAGTAVIYTNAAWPTQLPTMPGAPQRAGGIASVPDANLWRAVRHFPGRFFTILTVPSWVCAGIHMCGALPSPVCA